MALAFKARVNDPAVASYRYRVLAPIAFLSTRGWDVEVYDEARADRYEAVVFSKAYAAEDRALARRLKAAGKRVIVDLCDDHFFNPAGLPKYRKVREDLTAMLALADQVVCSTPVLAATVRREAGLLATPAVAPDIYEKAGVEAGPPAPKDEAGRLLWFGLHGSPNAEAGMADLLLIRDQLAAAGHKRALELVVCSNSRAKYDSLFKDFPVPTRYVEWSPETFAEELAQAQAVVLPLSDNPFVAAKTHNRLSLALSAGVPVVADAIDSYQEFAPYCWLNDWPAGLEAVLLRPDAARARARKALAYLDANWSAAAVAPQWEAALGLGIVTAQARPCASDAITDWLIGEARAERTWLLAGPAADPLLVAQARTDGLLVMFLGAGFTRFEADLAYVADIETVIANAAALERGARYLLMPADPHVGGWATGRRLESWAADLPVLRRMKAAGRLLNFDLWTGSPQGAAGDFQGVETPLRLLVGAGTRLVRHLGVDLPAANDAIGPTSILERQGGLAQVLATPGLSFEPYDPSRPEPEPRAG